MEDKKPFHIDENALREKLLNYHVSFNPASLDFLENEIDHIKTSIPFKLPEIKKILQFSAVPVIIIAFGFVAYFGFNYIKDVSEKSAVKKDTVITTAPPPKPKVEIKNEEVKAPVVTTASVTPEAPKKDTIEPVATTTTVHKQTKETKKIGAEQVVTPKKEDTTQTTNLAGAKPDSIKKVAVDTASTSKSKDSTTKKKKYYDTTKVGR